jgi:hypothetical protein
MERDKYEANGSTCGERGLPGSCTRTRRRRCWLEVSKNNTRLMDARIATVEISMKDRQDDGLVTGMFDEHPSHHRDAHGRYQGYWIKVLAVAIYIET